MTDGDFRLVDTTDALLFTFALGRKGLATSEPSVDDWGLSGEGGRELDLDGGRERLPERTWVDILTVT